MSLGVEIATPATLTGVLLPASIGMEQQTPIAAPHQGEPEAREADRAITQVVAFPAALGQVASAEKDARDFAVGRVIETCVKRTQSEDEAVAAGLREVGGIGTRGAARELCQKAADREARERPQGVEDGLHAVKI